MIEQGINDLSTIKRLVADLQGDCRAFTLAHRDDVETRLRKLASVAELVAERIRSRQRRRAEHGKEDSGM